MMIPWYDEAALEAYKGSIASLSDLALRESLRALTIDAQRIADLSPLAGLPLQHLSVQYNPVVDASPLAECRSLRKVYTAFHINYYEASLHH
jgi:Leucine-rich repeat (LRR) protein